MFTLPQVTQNGSAAAEWHVAVAGDEAAALQDLLPLALDRFQHLLAGQRRLSPPDSTPLVYPVRTYYAYSR